MATALDAYFPFDAGAGANVVEAQWKYLARNFQETGIVAGITNEFSTVGDSSGMQVKVATGEANLQGFYGRNTSEKTIAIAAADGANPRFDRVVLRVTFATNLIEIDILKGTAGASPAKPSLTQDTGEWEIPLALVYVDARSGTVTANDVIDERVFDYADLINTARVGLVKGLPTADDVRAIAPTSTNAGNDTVTYGTAPVWAVDGQGVQISATTNGLSVNTLYYIGAVAGGTFSFYTQLNHALAGSGNEVDLTGNIQPSTIFPCLLYYQGGKNAEISIDIKALVLSSNYEVWLSTAAGLPELSFSTVWTNRTTQAEATAIDTPASGLWTKSGTPASIAVALVGTTGSTGQVLDHGGNTLGIGGQRFVWNYHNRIGYKDYSYDDVDSWLLNNAAYVAFNGGDANWKHEFVIGVNEYPMSAFLHSHVITTQSPSVHIALDGVVQDIEKATTGFDNNGVTTLLPSEFGAHTGIGYHYLQCIHRNTGAGNSTFQGDNGQPTREQSGWIAKGER